MSTFKALLAAKAETTQRIRALEQSQRAAKDQPITGKTYALTGTDSIASGKSWAESEVKQEMQVTQESTIDFDEYRRQVDELIKHLSIPMADLAVVAVACLYRETFAN